MQLKTSLFNKTIFKENILSTRLLWIILSIIGSLFPISLYLNSRNGNINYESTVIFNNDLYSVAIYAAPFVAMILSTVLTYIFYAYLFNSKGTGFMHSIPLKRENLFFTNFVSELVVITIPYAITFLFFLIITNVLGLFSLKATLMTIVLVTIQNIIFISLSLLAVMVTANAGMYVLFVGIINFGSVLMGLLITTFAKKFLFGVETSTPALAQAFSPMYNLLEKANVNNFKYIYIYGVVSLVILAATIYLYKLRKSETSGDSLTFKILNPIFIYVFSFFFAIAMGMVTYSIVSFDNYDKAYRLLPITLFVAIWGVIGYIISKAAVEKKKVVIKQNMLPILSVILCSILLCLGLHLDVFKIENKVPSIDKINTVEFSSGGFVYEIETKNNPEQVQLIHNLHQAIVNDKVKLERSNTENDNWVSIVYTLNNGNKMKREYRFPRNGEIEEINSAYNEIIDNADLLITHFKLNSGYNFECSIYRYDEKNEETISLNETQTKEIIEKIKSDIYAENITGSNYYRYDPYEYEMPLYNIELRWKTDENNYRYQNIDVIPEMTETLEFIKTIDK